MLLDPDDDAFRSLPDDRSDLEPLAPNPGGIGDPATSLVGRDAELQRLQEAIVHGGAYVTGERRMGKTWLVKRLQDDLADTVTAVYVSAETDNLDTFARRLLDALKGNRLIKDRVSEWEKEVGGRVELKLGVATLGLSAKGTQPAGTRNPPDLDVLDVLTHTRERAIVLIIDEITHLCHNLGPDAATEFLSGLRAHRQSGGVPLVLSGSIGLHHALPDMRAVNDLWVVKVGALEPHAAVLLTARLLVGIGVEPENTLIRDILQQTSGIPFYVHAVVDRLRASPGASTDVGSLVQECLTENLWHTDHYESRMASYYGPDLAELAAAVVDEVAVSNTGLTVDDIRNRLLARDRWTTVTRSELGGLLDRLEQDHYLTRTPDGRDRMSSPLLGRIWRHHRRLP